MGMEPELKVEDLIESWLKDEPMDFNGAAYAVAELRLENDYRPVLKGGRNGGVVLAGKTMGATLTLRQRPWEGYEVEAMFDGRRWHVTDWRLTSS